MQGCFRDSGDDEFLDEGEDVEVSVAHDLVELELLLLVEAVDFVNAAEAVRQEALRQIEVSSVEDVVLLPGNLLRLSRTFRMCSCG